MLTKFCDDHRLSIRKCGQLVTTNSNKDIERLKELERRAKVANIPIELLNEEQTQKIDPNIKTRGVSLYTPVVSTIVPKQVCLALERENRDLGVDILTRTHYTSRNSEGINTNKGKLTYKKLFNTTGCYVDRIAHDYGFALEHKIIPFTVSFIKSVHPTQEVATTIFGVPDFKFPYVEVKQTPMPDGRLKIGPAVTPAIGRESHFGITRVPFTDMVETVIADIELGVLYRHDVVNYVALCASEYKKKMIWQLKREANKQLIKPLKGRYRWDQRGIMPCVFNTKERKYVTDLLVFNNEKSCHVVNPVFPGFTTAFSTAELIANKYSV
jgi:L-2-hydroxyglutarate oxidase LhgO